MVAVEEHHGLLVQGLEAGEEVGQGGVCVAEPAQVVREAPGIAGGGGLEDGDGVGVEAGVARVVLHGDDLGQDGVLVGAQVLEQVGVGGCVGDVAGLGELGLGAHLVDEPALVEPERAIGVPAPVEVGHEGMDADGGPGVVEAVDQGGEVVCARDQALVGRQRVGEQAARHPRHHLELHVRGAAAEGHGTHGPGHGLVHEGPGEGDRILPEFKALQAKRAMKLSPRMITMLVSAKAWGSRCSLIALASSA